MNTRFRTTFARRALLATALAACVLPTWAQGTDSYPSKAIRMIVPYPPGGATDVVARLISQRLAAALKQPVTVENKAGGNGMIGTEFVAKAAPDGYTLLMNTAGAQIVSPILYKANYGLKSFEPIMQVADINFLLVVNPNVPAKTLQEYVALARANKQPMNYAAGTSMLELTAESFKSAANIPNVQAIPYKGTGPQTTAVLSGEVGMTIDPFVAVQHVKAGKLRALGVFAKQRSHVLPDVPTLAESGYPGMNYSSWTGLLAPAGTPKEIVARLSDEMQKIVADPDMKAKLMSMDYDVIGSTPAQMATAMAEEDARWRKIVKDLNYKAQQ